MQAAVRMREPQRDTVRCAAERREIVLIERGMQVRREVRQWAPRAIQPLAAEVQVGFTGERADRRSAQLLHLLLVARAKAGVGHRPLRQPPNAPRANDSSSSWSKQRW